MKKKFSREEVKVNIDGEILTYTIFSKTLTAYIFLISFMDRINPGSEKNLPQPQHS